MSLRIRSLQLRAMTPEGPYGATVRFGEGLTVLWADNTKGKSTCMQGMLYALGLERMLSPRREIPLPHAMTSYLDTDDNRKVPVLESRVSLEIENAEGQIITVNRSVKALTDSRLITVDFGPALTGESRELKRQNFFVLDGGAAQREDGFHHFLESFLGWQLPQVRRYDAPETKLYLETVFPLFWVEQKFGWSAIPAAIPTYLRIREVHKRAVEFIMNLDVYKLEVQRERLAEKFISNAKDWAIAFEELNRFLLRNGGRIAGLSDKPVADPSSLDSAHVQIAEGTEWLSLSTVVSALRVHAQSLSSLAIPNVEDQSEEVIARLDSLVRRVDELNVTRVSTRSIQQLKSADMLSLERRIETLSSDLAKNLDVQRLQRYSGTGANLVLHRCPTCEQELVDTLLSQEAMSSVMPIADNIEYIRSQKKMFEDILGRERADAESRNSQLGAVNSEVMDLYAQIRLLRSELVAPGSNPSAAAIEERIRAEAKIRDLEFLQAAFDESMERLEAFRTEFSLLLEEKEKIPAEKLSSDDKDKLRILTKLVQSQAGEFEFRTFPADEISISEDSYRPEKEGYEIGFETSASDAIRLKWAYQLGLLELADLAKTNHPNLLLFDEPRQQSSSKISFQKLLGRAAEAKKRGQQVIFSTSEDLETLRRITADLDCHEVSFLGYILQPIV